AAPLFERRQGIRSERAVLLVDEHLAPVFDDDVSGWLALIAKEGTAQIRARLAVQDVPLAIRAEQVLEGGLPSGLHRELPHDCNHGGNYPSSAGGFAPPGPLHAHSRRT